MECKVFERILKIYKYVTIKGDEFISELGLEQPEKQMKGLKFMEKKNKIKLVY